MAGNVFIMIEEMMVVGGSVVSGWVGMRLNGRLGGVDVENITGASHVIHAIHFETDSFAKVWWCMPKMDVIRAKSVNKVSVDEDFALVVEILDEHYVLRVVDFNVNAFFKQSQEYQNQVLPKGYKRMVIET